MALELFKITFEDLKYSAVEIFPRLTIFKFTARVKVYHTTNGFDF